jgi:hypothetical protein
LAGAVRRFLALPLLLAACGAPAYKLPIDRQRDAAGSLAPAKLPQREREQPVRKLRVRITADRDHRRAILGWQLRAYDQVNDASEVLSTRFGIALEIVESRELDWSSGMKTLEHSLDELRRRDSGEDVDLVIGFLAPLEISTGSLHQLGLAEILGKHIVIRAMDDSAERRWIAETFHLLRGDEVDHIYRDRLRHKERVVLLHEIGHAFGALHSAREDDFMAPMYSPGAADFSPKNAELVAYELEARGPGRDRPEARAEARAKMIEALERASSDGWVDQSRERMLSFLKNGTRITFDRDGEREEAPGKDGETGSLNAVIEELRRGETTTAWEILKPLLEKKPDDATISSLACEISVRRAKEDPEADARCARAAAADPKNAAPPLHRAHLALERDDASAAIPLLSEGERRLSAMERTEPEAWAYVAAMYRDALAVKAAERAAGRAPDHEESKSIASWASAIRARYDLPSDVGDEEESLHLRTLLAIEDAIRARKAAEAERLAKELGQRQEAASLILCEGIARTDKRSAARRYCERAAKISAKEARARKVMGFLDLSEGKLSSALSQLERAARLSPGDKEIELLLAAARRSRR